MIATLLHRGPDDGGVFARGSTALASRRLAVIDLSMRGHQPLSNEDGTIWIVLNGEIYNFESLRTELEDLGHRFASDTDTEVIVHLYEEMGVECVTRLRGMFAFAVWDEPRQRLFLARDRLGQKPLFYHQDESTFRFASEPRAILQDHRVSAEPDLEALHFYLTYGFTPSPSSAFRGIRKLSPAHRLVLQDGTCTVDRYWTLSYRNQRNGDDRELTDELIDRLDEAVRLRMRSDVPLGVLLSGGLDSSTVVALMSSRATQPVRTFSIGFKETNYDERRYAREVASYFGTDHQELIVEPDVVGCLPQSATAPSGGGLMKAPRRGLR